VTILTIPAALIGSIAVGYLLYIFAVLSRKLGAVTKARPYYRWLYVSLVIIVVTTVIEWIILTVRITPQNAPEIIVSEWSLLIGRTIPLVVAAVIALVVVLRYWGWLFREHDR
jgi:hypothetical protein